MRFSKRTDYGLIFLSLLRDASKSGGLVAISDVSEKYGVPYSFMEKIASALKAAGIITAKKGKDGGYALAKHPAKITMEEVMEALERPKIMKCLEKGGSACFLQTICPTRRRWQTLDKKIIKVFRSMTIAEL